MEYIYAAMLLHKAGKEVNEANVKKVLDAAGVKVDEGRIKALIVALEGINIDEAIKEAAQVAVAPVAISQREAKTEEKPKEEKKEDDGKKADEAAAGLGSLFG